MLAELPSQEALPTTRSRRDSCKPAMADSSSTYQLCTGQAAVGWPRREAREARANRGFWRLAAEARGVESLPSCGDFMQHGSLDHLFLFQSLPWAYLTTGLQSSILKIFFSI